MLDTQAMDIDQLETRKLPAMRKGSTTPLPVVAPEETPEPQPDPYALWDEEARLVFADLCIHLGLPALTPEHLSTLLHIVQSVADGPFFHSPCTCWMRYPAEVWAEEETHTPECLYVQAQQLMAEIH